MTSSAIVEVPFDIFKTTFFGKARASLTIAMNRSVRVEGLKENEEK